MYVIGHHNAWATTGVFVTASAMLPVVNWPFDPRQAIEREDEHSARWDVEDDEEEAETIDPLE